MALKHILARLASDLGGDPSSQRAYWVDKINLAARDLYNQYDLVGSLEEDVFEIDEDTSIITLPYFVEDVRAVRNAETGDIVKVRDRIPRFQTASWKTRYDWRVLRRDVPSRLRFNYDTTVRVVLLAPEEKPLTVSIVGKTSKSSSFEEILTFLPGDTEKTTSTVFSANCIWAINKSSVTKSDIEIYTINNELLAEIPNTELSPAYMWVQIEDFNVQRASSSLVEVLYKKRFLAMSKDDDKFLGTDLYDDAVYWNTLAFVWAKTAEADGMLQKIQMAASKSRFIINTIFDSYNRGKDYKLDFGLNRFEHMTKWL